MRRRRWRAERARVETEGWGARLLALSGRGRSVGGRRVRPARIHRASGRPKASRGLRLRTCSTRSGVRPRPARRARAAHGRADRRATHAGSTTASRSGRARSRVHQRPHGRRSAPTSASMSRRSSRAWSASGSTTAAGTATARARLGPLVVRHHDQRARGPAGVRAGDRRHARSPAPRAPRRGIPAGARPVPAAQHRRARRPRATCSRIRAAGTTTCCGRSTTSGAADRPPDPRLAEAVEHVRSRRRPDGTLAARPAPARPGLVRAGRRRRATLPLDHPAGAAGAALVGRRLRSRHRRRRKTRSGRGEQGAAARGIARLRPVSANAYRGRRRTGFVPIAARTSCRSLPSGSARSARRDVQHPGAADLALECGLAADGRQQARADARGAGVALGRSSAAAPLTSGAAIEVPLE